MSASTAEETSRSRAAGTFVLCAVWLLALLVVSIVVVHLIPGEHAPVARAAAQLVLTGVGFYWIALRRVPELRPLSAVGFVRRPSQWPELALGLALGWSIAVALVLPALATRNLHTLLEFDGNHGAQSAEALVLEVLLAVLTPVVFQGIVFRSLVRSAGETVAVPSVALVSFALVLFTPGHDAGMALFAALAAIVLSLAALRTRAIWVPIGMLAGWGISLNVLFGVGSFYWPTTSGIVTSYVTGPRWLTGSVFGPEASVWGLLVVVAALVAVVRLTRDYAWHYAHDPIEPAGYPMDLSAPAEHTRMEEAAARKTVPLVQIQPAGPTLPQV